MSWTCDGNRGERRRRGFIFDEWLYDPSWVDGRELGRGRGVVHAAIDRLPPPDPKVGYRYVKVSPQGHLWVRRPGREEMDVEYLELYALEGAERAPTRVIADDGAGQEQPTRALPAETMATIRSTLENLATMQEVYYASGNGRYASDVEQLGGWEAPEDLLIRIVNASPRGRQAATLPRRPKARLHPPPKAAPPRRRGRRHPPRRGRLPPAAPAAGCPPRREAVPPPAARSAAAPAREACRWSPPLPGQRHHRHARAGPMSTTISRHFPCLNRPTLSVPRVMCPSMIASQMSPGSNPRVCWNR